MPDPTTYGLSATSTVSSYATLLGVKWTPRGEYFPDRGRRQLANGQMRSVGLPWCRHIWDVLPQTQRDVLRGILTATSGTCYIWTRTNDSTDAFKVFTATYTWPEGNENKDALKRLDFVLEFRNLVLVT